MFASSILKFFRPLIYTRLKIDLIGLSVDPEIYFTWHFRRYAWWNAWCDMQRCKSYDVCIDSWLRVKIGVWHLCLAISPSSQSSGSTTSVTQSYSLGSTKTMLHNTSKSSSYLESKLFVTNLSSFNWLVLGENNFLPTGFFTCSFVWLWCYLLLHDYANFLSNFFFLWNLLHCVIGIGFWLCNY